MQDGPRPFTHERHKQRREHVLEECAVTIYSPIQMHNGDKFFQHYAVRKYIAYILSLNTDLQQQGQWPWTSKISQQKQKYVYSDKNHHALELNAICWLGPPQLDQWKTAYCRLKIKREACRTAVRYFKMCVLSVCLNHNSWDDRRAVDSSNLLHVVSLWIS